MTDGNFLSFISGVFGSVGGRLAYGLKDGVGKTGGSSHLHRIGLGISFLLSPPPAISHGVRQVSVSRPCPVYLTVCAHVQYNTDIPRKGEWASG